MSNTKDNPAESSAYSRKPSSLAGVFASRVSCFLPGLAVAGAVAFSITGYEPLVFDPSLYPAPAPVQAKALEIIDPDETSVRETGRAYDGSLDEAAFEMPATGLVDGVYRASAYGYKSDITVQVTISDGHIIAIEILSQGEDGEYFNRAVGVIPSILESQSTSVDVVSGATFSSKGIISAVNKCLQQASAGEEVKEPEQDAPQSAPQPNNQEIVDTIEPAELEVEGLLDGTYTSYTYCQDEKNPTAYKPYYLVVSVRVEKGAAVEIVDVYGTDEATESDARLEEYDQSNDMYLDWAAWGKTIRSENVTYTGIADQIAQGGYARLSSYDVVSGATYSSAALAKGYNAALDLSRAAFAQAYRDGLIDEHGNRLDSRDPVDSVEPSAPVDPAEPAGPTDPTDPTVPSGPVEPGDPTEPTPPADPANPNEPADSDSPSDSANPDEPSEPQDPQPTIDPQGLQDGTYVGYSCCSNTRDAGAWSPYYVAVAVEVQDGVVACVSDVFGCDVSPDHGSVLFYDDDENGDYLYKAAWEGVRRKGILGIVDQIAQFFGLRRPVVLGQDIDVVSGATYSSQSIVEAYNSALAKSHAAYLQAQGEQK